MYINAKQRENKHKVKVYYIYLCESVRVEGRVKNTQRYVGSIKETELAEQNFDFLAEKEEGFTIDEMTIIINKLNEMANKYKK